jgi:hypothetical protein
LNVLQRSFKKTKFDPILLFVKLGRLEVAPVEFGDREKAIKKKNGIGKKHAQEIFDWLYKQKEVRTIIKVTVEDGATLPAGHSDYIPHSDRAVYESLELFDIEILDWRKIDLCPEAIVTACKSSEGLRELHLWWSGNNAILQAWSGTHGLKRLVSLKEIHIHEAKVRNSIFSTLRAVTKLNSIRLNLLLMSILIYRILELV